MIHLLILLSLPLLFFSHKTSSNAYETKISSISSFIQFSKNVNSGTSYSGTTVLLDTDITFSSSQAQSFSPIGDGIDNFCGTFDGQGHTISGLKMSSSSY